GVNLSSLSSGQIFTVLFSDNYPATTPKGGLWEFGIASPGDFYLAGDGNAAFGFGRSKRFVFSDFFNSINITKPQLIEMSSSVLFEVKFNKNLFFTTNDGIVSFSSNTAIGKTKGGNYFYHGKM